MTAKSHPIRDFWKKMPDKVQIVSSTVSAIIVLGGVVVGGVNWMVGRIDARFDQRFAKVEGQIESNTRQLENFMSDAKMSLARAELLNLIADFPDNREDILKAADYYFCTLNGDYVADQAFISWASQHGVDSGYISNCR